MYEMMLLLEVAETRYDDQDLSLCNAKDRINTAMWESKLLKYNADFFMLAACASLDQKGLLNLRPNNK